MRKEFEVHMLNDDGKAKAIKLGEIFSTALNEIEQLVPVGREMSLVVTLMQKASFFAKRGIAINPANQQK